MQVKIKIVGDRARMPHYATPGSGAFDLYAIETKRGHDDYGSVVCRTGLAFEIPPGYVMLIFSRSGHGFKNGVRLANCVGVIDSDYRGEVRVKLTHDGHRDLPVRSGDRIAQAEICPIFRVDFEDADSLSATDRGSNGFGSTGA